MNEEEVKLIADIKADGTESIKKMYSTCMTYIYKIIGDSSRLDAEDLFQDAMVVLIENVKKDKFNGNSKLTTYFYSIARNIFLYRSKLSREQAWDEVAETKLNNTIYEYEDPTVFELKIKNLMTKLELMNEDCRRILRSFYFDRMKMDQIAEAHNYTTGFVRVKKNRCMKTLKKMFYE